MHFVIGSFFSFYFKLGFLLVANNDIGHLSSESIIFF